MKQVDFEKPTQFLDQVFLGYTVRDRNPNRNLVDEYTQMFESLTSAGTVGKLPGSGESCARIAAWSCDMEGHAKKMREPILRMSSQEHRATVKKSPHASQV